MSKKCNIVCLLQEKLEELFPSKKDYIKSLFDENKDLSDDFLHLVNFLLKIGNTTKLMK